MASFNLSTNEFQHIINTCSKEELHSIKNMIEQRLDDMLVFDMSGFTEEEKSLLDGGESFVRGVKLVRDRTGKRLGEVHELCKKFRDRNKPNCGRCEVKIINDTMKCTHNGKRVCFDCWNYLCPNNLF